MQAPSLLDDKQYNLRREDFMSKEESPFYAIIFAAISNLYEDGNEVIDVISVDSFLSAYPKQYQIYNDNQGIEYLQKASEETHTANFEYNFKRVKKFALLREYETLGISTKELYDDTILHPLELEDKRKEFERMTVDDIINFYDGKQNTVREKFMLNNQVVTEKAGSGSLALFQSFKTKPDYGISLIGDIQNRIFRGAKKSVLSMRSAPSNLGKTRIALAEATDMAIDEWYDTTKKEWVSRNNPEPTLFISTEVEREKLEPTIWAYISGVAEKKIKDALLTEEEEERVMKAIEILDRANFWIDYIPDFDTNLIETKIKQHIFENNIKYCYFD